MQLRTDLIYLHQCAKVCCGLALDSKLQVEKILSDRSLIWMSDLDYFYICKTLNLSLCSAKYLCKYQLFHLVASCCKQFSILSQHSHTYCTDFSAGIYFQCWNWFQYWNLFSVREFMFSAEIHFQCWNSFSVQEFIFSAGQCYIINLISVQVCIYNICIYPYILCEPLILLINSYSSDPHGTATFKGSGQDLESHYSGKLDPDPQHHNIFFLYNFILFFIYKKYGLVLKVQYNYICRYSEI